MFNKKKQPAIKSLIAEGCQIEGDFNFVDGLRFDGVVNGQLCGHSGGSTILVISETAVVTGEIQADHIIINGSVNGPVHARRLLELQPNARIYGDVHYAALEMHQGATISGQLRPMVDEEKPTLKLAANNA